MWQQDRRCNDAMCSWEDGIPRSLNTPWQLEGCIKGPYMGIVWGDKEQDKEQDGFLRIPVMVVLSMDAPPVIAGLPACRVPPPVCIHLLGPVHVLMAENI